MCGATSPQVHLPNDLLGIGSFSEELDSGDLDSGEDALYVMHKML
jgi:hypothetical protein